jgi:tetratricopeptide (TPR) repeat protein
MARFRSIAGQITLLFLAAAAPAVLAQETATPATSVCQARRTIVTELRRVFVSAKCDLTSSGCLKSQPSGVAFNSGEVEFQAAPGYDKKLFPQGTYRIDLKTLGEVTVQKNVLGSPLRVDGRRPIWGQSILATEENARKNLSSSSILGFLGWWSDDRKAPDDNAAQTFANAMNTLRLYARSFNASRGLPPVCFADKDEQARIWAEFQKMAAAWRALPARPPLSEAVRKQQLLAEDAVNQKQFEAAAAAYDAGTEIDPMWPEGHFNAAAIYGELKDYDDAVWHMRCYLELVPSAPDAQNARDQILLWQAKLEQQTAAQ